MYKNVILLLLLFLNLEILECCKPENFKYFKVVEKLTRSTSKTNRWKEASFYGRHVVDSHPLIIANEEIPRCREKPNIEEFEQNLRNAEIIEIHLHNIPVIRTGDVQNLDVINIYLQDNNIERVEAEAFQNLRLLHAINLADNNIKEIPSLAFSNLDLEVIDLTNNNIDSLDTGAFNNLDKLKQVYLGTNKLTNFDSKWFTNTPNIKFLEVSYNKLKNIPEGSFEPFKKNLEKVDLSYNQIEDVHPSLFKDAPKLNFLNLVHNQVKCLSEGVLESFPVNMNVVIIGNEDMKCACLTKMQKFALEHFSESTIISLDRYMQVKCNDEILGALDNALKRISVLEGQS
ncbi:hypothetical protein ILUMI_03290 [Ignelater luminosus]|uniref:Uncharacterized protein n=1 Tax=Ignelater luminosus TaxID=2038154 RepID=A0A8K0DGM0_IGNLU|nr:hypothetical protein ILUMI_03290 [Ignelater luminosus]